MNGCIYRTEENKCKQFSVGGVMSFCYLDGTCDCQIPSNADRIRAMTDEELAKWMVWYGNDGITCKFEDCDIVECGYGPEYDSAIDWLKSPVEVDK